MNDQAPTTSGSLPPAEYERLVAAATDRAVAAAIRVLNNPNEAWRDAQDVLEEVAPCVIARVRKARGLSQTDLGRLLGIPQSQVSRIEKAPDKTSVGMIRRIAKALGTDVRSLF